MIHFDDCESAHTREVAARARLQRTTRRMRELVIRTARTKRREHPWVLPLAAFGVGVAIPLLRARARCRCDTARDDAVAPGRASIAESARELARGVARQALCTLVDALLAPRSAD